jgi:hypothetical protein
VARKAFRPPVPRPAEVAVVRPPLPRPPELHVPPFLPVAPAASAIDPEAAELRTHYALHRARACMGEGIEVRRTGGELITVRGVVQSAARRQEIEALLSLLTPPGSVRVQFFTLAELPAAGLDSLPPAPPPESGEAAATIPMEPLLLERYRRIYPEVSAEVRQRRVIDLSNHVLRLAGVALAHAWAVRNFAVEYPPPRLHRLSGADLMLAREMVKEHSAELSAACSELAARLEGQVASGVSVEVPAAFLTWQEAAEATLQQIRQMHADASDLFSCGRPVADVSARARRMLRLLAETQTISAEMRTAALAPQ